MTVIQKLSRPIKLAVGALLFLIGLILSPLPLPLGQLIALVGLCLLISESAMVRRQARKLRRNIPAVNRMAARITPYLPAFLKEALTATDPRHLMPGAIIEDRI